MYDALSVISLISYTCPLPMIAGASKLAYPGGLVPSAMNVLLNLTASMLAG